MPADCRPEREAALDVHLVHGMTAEPAPPDWPPLETDEVRGVIARLPRLGGIPAAEAVIEWHSPRPFSAAALVLLGGDGTEEVRVVVKRHHRRVREVGGLEEEHGFSRWLLGRGVPAAPPLGSPIEEDGFVYEVHGLAPGLDRYRDAWSWTPFRSHTDASAAGRALARLHRASSGYAAPSRRRAPLLASTAVIDSPDPLAAIESLAAERPGLAAYLDTRPWRTDLGPSLLRLQRAYLPHASKLEPLWTHNDWHPSNLLWAGGAEDEHEPADGAEPEVSGVIDFGLCNRTTACYDLATALERSVVGWLEPADHRPVHLDHVAALLAGYRSVRPLTRHEAAALPYLLPVVHVDYALSEIEYFHDVVGSPTNAALAYEGYLVGHLEWFPSTAGRELCARLGELLAG